MRPEKLSLWWQLYSMFMHGRAYYAIYEPGQRPFTRWACLLLLPYTLIFCIRALVQSWLWRDRNRYPAWQNYLYESEQLAYRVHRLGVWSAYVQTFWFSVPLGSHRPSERSAHR